MKDEEWLAVLGLCEAGVEPLGETEERVLAGFEVVASVAIYLFAVYRLQLIWAKGLDEAYGGGKTGRRLEDALWSFSKMLSRLCERPSVRVVLLCIPAALAAPLLWGLFRLRSIQRQLASSRGHDYDGDDWGFGQVMALVLFLPLLTKTLVPLPRGPPNPG